MSQEASKKARSGFSQPWRASSPWCKGCKCAGGNLPDLRVLRDLRNLRRVARLPPPLLPSSKSSSAAIGHLRLFWRNRQRLLDGGTERLRDGCAKKRGVSTLFSYTRSLFSPVFLGPASALLALRLQLIVLPAACCCSARLLFRLLARAHTFFVSSLSRRRPFFSFSKMQSPPTNPLPSPG
jgi:hypothetical protein